MPTSHTVERGVFRRESYSISLQHAASALWGDGFWGREQPGSEEVRRDKKQAQR